MKAPKQSTRASLAGLALFSLLATGLVVTDLSSSHAFAGEGSPGENQSGEGDDDGANGPFGPDDEAVGTLPIKGRDDGPLRLPDNPGIYIRGEETAVWRAVVDATGDGFVLLTEHPGSDELQLTFHGQVEVEFDAAVLSGAGLQTGLVSTDLVNPSRAAALTDHDLLMQARLEAGARLELPITDFQESGVLDGDGVRLLTASPLLGRDWMEVHGLGGVIRMRHVPVPGL